MSPDQALYAANKCLLHPKLLAPTGWRGTLGVLAVAGRIEPEAWAYAHLLGGDAIRARKASYAYVSVYTQKANIGELLSRRLRSQRSLYNSLTGRRAMPSPPRNGL